MTDKIRTKKEKDLETYLQQSIKNNAPTVFENLQKAKENNLMLVLESSDFKADTTDHSYVIIGMIVKYAAIIGVEVRMAPDDSLGEEEK